MRSSDTAAGSVVQTGARSRSPQAGRGARACLLATAAAAALAAGGAAAPSSAQPTQQQSQQLERLLEDADQALRRGDDQAVREALRQARRAMDSARDSTLSGEALEFLRLAELAMEHGALRTAWVALGRAETRLLTRVSMAPPGERAATGDAVGAIRAAREALIEREVRFAHQLTRRAIALARSGDAIGRTVPGAALSGAGLAGPAQPLTGGGVRGVDQTRQQAQAAQGQGQPQAPQQAQSAQGGSAGAQAQGAQGQPQQQRQAGVASDQFPTIRLAPGYRIERVAGGLSFPTSLTWDDQGRLHVAEAGGGLEPEQLAPPRILRVEEGGGTTVVANLDGQVRVAVVGLAFHNGAFYITHRAEDLTGAVSRVAPDGQVTKLFDGIIDSQAEHQINDIRVGPDGRMYVSVGAAGNAGVVGPSIAPWVRRSPGLHTTTCRDIVLNGRNFRSSNFLTQDPNDEALTGAFVPFGTETQPGQRISSTNKCGGSILAFNTQNAEQTITSYAWGFRNLLGLAWNPRNGQMFAAQNGYDVRGSRPVQDEGDPVYRVREGAWYGVPDFSAALAPLTEGRFEVPDQYQAMVVVNGEPQGKNLAFVIDHAASGLVPPDPSLLLSMHPFNSSPSMIDVAPPSWGDHAGHVVVAEWGDLAPPTNPMRGREPAGYRVVQVDPDTGRIEPLVWNASPGPASGQGAEGQGLERPFDVQFGPDGALYITDYGVVRIEMPPRGDKPPYRPQPGTGAIWRVTRQPQR
ncbi:MAG TPA: hypothetical protein VGN83_09830 [Falsiroseomonas sp.]|jgi:glucose/arabinose dehydrogenase|nr:hypothetical protein [Falsiroseomonas sp.]